MRNVRGPVHPEALRSWALLGRLGAGQSASGGHLAILHHTDCGIRRLASYPEQLAAFFEIPVADLGSKAVEDPYTLEEESMSTWRGICCRPTCSCQVWSTTWTHGLIEVVVPATTEQRRVKSRPPPRPRAPQHLTRSLEALSTPSH